VPIAAVALIAITVSGSFRFWERAMFVFVFASFLVIPLLVIADPNLGDVAHHLVIPGIYGGANSTSVLLIIGMVGTTVAPWQLFFQQSNVIDKRITPRWINYERLDTWIGAFIVVSGGVALIAISAFAFKGTHYFGQFTNAGGTATGLDHVLGSAAAAFFAIVLLNASLIGAGALTLSTSYAFGDVFGIKSSLHRGFRDAKLFYGIFAALIAGAAAIVLIPGAPLGVITLAVQALAGVLLPSATVFLVLVQRPRGARAMAQPRLAQRHRLNHRRHAHPALADPDGNHDLPNHQRHRRHARRRRGARCRTRRLRAARAQIPPRSQGHHSDPARTLDTERAMDDAPARAARPTPMVDRTQSRDAHTPRLPPSLNDPADHQSHPTRRRIAPPTSPRSSTSPTRRSSTEPRTHVAMSVTRQPCR
jgi:Natural resistance-associated macrophage protein